MKFKRLNNRGFSHDIVLLLFVLIFAIGGVGYLVASHADNPCTSGLNPTTSIGQCYSSLGQVNAPGSNETVSAYACVTKVTTTEWRTIGVFQLSNSVNTPTSVDHGVSWKATITNNGTNPIPNNQSTWQYFGGQTTPYAMVTIYSNPQYQNPLTFSYTETIPLTGATVSTGSIGQVVHPDQLVNCLTPTSLPTSAYSAYLNVTPTSGTVSFVHGNHNLSVIPQGTTFNPNLIYQIGTTIADKGAIAYKLTNWSFSGLSGISVPNAITVINPTGNLTPNQTTNMLLAMNPDIPNGTYNLIAYLSYEVPPTPTTPAQWQSGPTLNLSLVLSGAPYLDYLKANTLSVSETLHRSAVGPSGVIFGQPIILSSSFGTTYQLEESLNAPQGIGFYNSGTIPRNGSTAVQTYINPSKYANGVYTGSAVLQYRNDLGQMLNGPTISYNITLTN